MAVNYHGIYSFILTPFLYFLISDNSLYSGDNNIKLPEHVASLFSNDSNTESVDNEMVLHLSDPIKFNTIYKACSEAIDSILQFFIIKDDRNHHDRAAFQNFLPVTNSKEELQNNPYNEYRYDDEDATEDTDDFGMEDASDLVIFGNEAIARNVEDYNELTHHTYLEESKLMLPVNIGMESHLFGDSTNAEHLSTKHNQSLDHLSVGKRFKKEVTKKNKVKIRKSKGKGRPIGVIANTDLMDYPGIPKLATSDTQKFKYRPKGYYPDFCISKEAYDAIISNHVPNTPFICSQCQKSFKYRKRFDNHFVPGFQRCPGQPVDHLEPVFTTVNDRICCRYPGCTNELMSKTGVLNKKYIWKHHQKEHLANIDLPFKCKQCSETFLLQKFLVEHVSVVHKQHKKKCCSICGKILFGGKKSLDAHMIVHTGEKIWKCPSCDMSFSRKETRDRHVKWQHEASTLKLHICEICGKGCLTKPKLKDHILTHSDKGTFPCKLCGKYLKNDCSYRRHMVCVHGIKHTCDVCSRDYSSPVGLKIHRRDVHNIPF